MIRVARRLLLLSFTVLIAAWLLACTWLWLQQESMLFFPEPVSPENASRFAEYSLQLETPDGTLDGWYLPGSGQATLVYFGGNAVELSRRIEALQRLGDHGLLLLNYRGYGSSTGSPEEAGLKADALLVFDEAVAGLGLDPASLVITGRSLGSGIAAHVAAEREAAGLILITPYDSIAAVARGRYPWVPVTTLIRHPFNTLALLDRIDEPTLVIRAEYDSVIPHVHTDNLISQWQSELELHTLPGDHGSVVGSAQFDATLGAFIERVVQP